VASLYERPTRSRSGPFPSISSQLAESSYRSPIEADSSDEVQPQVQPEFDFEETDLAELDHSLSRLPEDPREPLQYEPLPLPFEELVAPSSTLHPPPPTDLTVREAALQIGCQSAPPTTRGRLGSLPTTMVPPHGSMPSGERYIFTSESRKSRTTRTRS
jgi:hypothetical protein